MVCRGLLRYRREVVERQLAESFPDADPTWIDATTRRCYRHFGQELAVLAGGAVSVTEAIERIDDETDSRRRIRDAVEAHGGAIVVTGHLGNWELGGARIASFGLPTTAVARRQSGRVDRRLAAMRDRLGFDVAYDDATPRTLVRALRSGRVLALVADQHRPQGGVQLDFMGRPAWTTLGPARLCLTADVPLFFAALLRDGRRYRTVFEKIDRGTGEMEPAVEITRRWLAVLERGVKDKPAQYFWFHRRWKKASGRHEMGNDTPIREVEQRMEAS